MSCRECDRMEDAADREIARIISVSERAALVAQRERDSLRDLLASRDLENLRILADGRRAVGIARAERDTERAAVVAYLRQPETADVPPRVLADEIERGCHIAVEESP